VVMIQGVNVGGGAWRPQMEGLGDAYRCLAFDNRGFGESLPCGERLTVDLLADDLLALMDGQEWPSAHLVGHSLGGLDALFAARRAPERVRSLSLLCTGARGSRLTRITPWTLAIGVRTRIGPRRLRRRAFLEIVMPREVLRQTDRDALAVEVGELFGHDLAEQPAIVMQQLATLRRADARGFLPELGGVPVLVASAEHDRLAPPVLGRALAGAIRGARFELLPGAAHGVTLQMPERVNALLREHFDAAEAQWQVGVE
jgi:pimeloyl-ACP methyl ester carboxylesterase